LQSSRRKFKQSKMAAVEVEPQVVTEVQATEVQVVETQAAEPEPEPEKNDKQTGTVKKWLPKGYGFIEMSSDGTDIFCHKTALLDGREYLNIGENVTFTANQDTKTDKLRAEGVSGDGTGEKPDLTPRDQQNRGGQQGGFGQQQGGFGGYQAPYGGGYGNPYGGGYGNPYGGAYGGGYGGAYGGGAYGGQQQGRDRDYGGRSSGGQGGSGGGVCYQFRDGGNCSYGDRCKFSHA